MKGNLILRACLQIVRFFNAEFSFIYYCIFINFISYGKWYWLYNFYFKVTVVVGPLNDEWPAFTDFPSTWPIEEAYYEDTGSTVSFVTFVATDGDKDVGSPDSTVVYGLVNDFGK